MNRVICISQAPRHIATRSSAIYCRLAHNNLRLFARQFSYTARTMTATKIDGTAIAKSIRERIAGEIQQKQSSNPRYKPSLTIVQGVYDLNLGHCSMLTFQ